MERTDDTTSYSRMRNFFLSFNDGNDDIIVFHIKVFLSVYDFPQGENPYYLYYMTSIVSDESLRGVIDYAIYNNKNGVKIDYMSFISDWNYIHRGELAVDIRDSLGNLPKRLDESRGRMMNSHLPYIKEKIKDFANNYNLKITEE